MFGSSLVSFNGVIDFGHVVVFFDGGGGCRQSLSAVERLECGRCKWFVIYPLVGVSIERFRSRFWTIRAPQNPNVSTCRFWFILCGILNTVLDQICLFLQSGNWWWNCFQPLFSFHWEYSGSPSMERIEVRTSDESLIQYSGTHSNDVIWLKNPSASFHRHILVGWSMNRTATSHQTWKNPLEWKLGWITWSVFMNSSHPSYFEDWVF